MLLLSIEKNRFMSKIYLIIFSLLRSVEESMAKYLQLSTETMGGTFSLRAISMLSFNQQVSEDVNKILRECCNILHAKLNYDVQGALVIVGCQIHKIRWRC